MYAKVYNKISNIISKLSAGIVELQSLKHKIFYYGKETARESSDPEQEEEVILRLHRSWIHYKQDQFYLLIEIRASFPMNY